MPYIHSTQYQDLKEINLNPEQTVTSVKNVWENMYPRKCMPPGKKQPASRWEGLEWKSLVFPL